jgi:DNA-binding NarL/FixJ family response regulator
MNGVEFLEKFKPSDHPKTQIVVFSNMAADSTLGAIKALGVVHYLTKAHYTPQDISHLVKQLLAGQGS